jgi:hypothetical protein
MRQRKSRYPYIIQVKNPKGKWEEVARVDYRWDASVIYDDFCRNFDEVRVLHNKKVIAKYKYKKKKF